jgi:hypothetical protein
MGAGIDTRSTRRESAAVVAEAFPATGQTTTMLAHRADASIFGAGQPTEEEVREYWTIVDGSLKAITGAVGFWRRQRARFSPRSLLADGRTALKMRGVRLGTLLPPRPAGTGSAGRAPATGRVETGPDVATGTGPAVQGGGPGTTAAASGADETTVLRNPGRKNHAES